MHIDSTNEIETHMLLFYCQWRNAWDLDNLSGVVAHFSRPKNLPKSQELGDKTKACVDIIHAISSYLGPHMNHPLGYEFYGAGFEGY